MAAYMQHSPCLPGTPYQPAEHSAFMAQGSTAGQIQPSQELPRLLGSSTEAARGAQHAAKLIAGLFGEAVPSARAPTVTPITTSSSCSTTDNEAYDFAGPHSVIATPESFCVGSLHAENFLADPRARYGALPQMEQATPAFGAAAAPRILELQQALLPTPAVLHLDSAIPAPAATHAAGSTAEAAVVQQGVMEGGEMLPSIGSVGHRLGVCKPCAFVFKEGCRSGTECKFCHLCDPGEKKRRKKERKEVRNAARAHA